MNIKNSLDNPIELLTAKVAISSIYLTFRNYDSAQTNLYQAKVIAEKFGIKEYLPRIYNNIADYYIEDFDKDSALKYSQMALQESLNDENLIMEGNAYYFQARAYEKTADFQKAEKLAKKALSIGRKTRDRGLLKTSVSVLAEIYYSIGDYKNAFEFEKEAQEYYDENTALAGQRSLMSIDFDKELAQQRLTDSLSKKLAMESAQKEILKKEVELYETKSQRFLLAGGVIAASLLILLLARTNQRRKRTNEIIKKQRDEIGKEKVKAESNFYIAETRKNELEERNREITDSINYAKRLQ